MTIETMRELFGITHIREEEVPNVKRMQDGEEEVPNAMHMHVGGEEVPLSQVITAMVPS
jgi:hypothetical protein